MAVTKAELNKDYLIYNPDQELDYYDVFRLTSSKLQLAPLPKDCMIAFFKSFSPFIIKMLGLREKIAKKLGLKTATETKESERVKQLNEFNGNIGDHIAIFEVLDKNDIELVSGQTDKHLDFKLSFVSFEADDQKKIVELITTVKIHNTVGKIYFFFVKPFHKYIMKRILKRMEGELIRQEEAR